MRSAMASERLPRPHPIKTCPARAAAQSRGCSPATQQTGMPTFSARPSTPPVLGIHR